MRRLPLAMEMVAFAARQGGLIIERSDEPEPAISYRDEKHCIELAKFTAQLARVSYLNPTMSRQRRRALARRGVIK